MLISMLKTYKKSKIKKNLKKFKKSVLKRLTFDSNMHIIGVSTRETRVLTKYVLNCKFILYNAYY